MEFHKVTTESVNLILDASKADMVRLYLKLSLKRRLASLNIYFNSRCLKLGVIPDYIRLKASAKTPAALGAISSAKTSWLRNELRQWYIRRNNLSTHLMLLHTELVHAYHPVEWDLIDDQVRWSVGELSRRKLTRLNEKLKKLSQGSLKPNEKLRKPVYHTPVVNLTNHQFSTEEMNVLSKGLLFTPCCPPSLRDMKHLSVDCELALRDQNNNVKSLVAEIISSHHSSSLVKQKKKTKSAPHVIKVVNNIKTTLQRKELVLCKTEEGSGAVIMKKRYYLEEIGSFLDSDNIHPEKDCTIKHRKKVIQILDGIKHALTRDQIKRLDIKCLPPKLYGLAMADNSIKPIISQTGTPAIKLASVVTDIIKKKTHFRPKHGVRSGVHLANALKNVVVPDSACLISFKVSDVFFSTPAKEAVKLVKGLLLDSGVEEDVTKELVTLMKLCNEQKFFAFQGEFFKQEEGLMMGSPLSHLLVDVFLDNLENSFLKSKKSVVKRVLYWHRHFDHVLCCFDGEEGYRYDLYNALNEFNPNVSFVPKVPRNQRVRFIDLIIEIVDKKHEFLLSKKALQKYPVIPADSWTHYSNKMAPFHSLTSKLLRLPLKEDEFSAALQKIKEIAQIKGYSAEIIDGMIVRKRNRKALRKIFGSSTLGEQSRDNCSLRHTGVLSYKLGKFLSSKLNLRPSFSNDKTLDRRLVNSKEQSEKCKMSGVYKLKCDDCECVYIGKTKTSFEDRMAKHASNKKETFHKHLTEKKHVKNFNYDILQVEKSNERLAELEIIEICMSHFASEDKSHILNKLLYRQHSPILTVLNQVNT